MGATAILEIMEEPGPIQVAQIYDQKQNPMNGRVYSEDGISPTLRTPTGGLSEPCILSPIRTEEQRQLRKQGVDTFSGRQMLPRTDGVSNTITTVQKDNLLQEPCILGYTRDGKGNVTSRHEKEIAGTLHTSTGSGGNTDQFVRTHYRIRKLTERECFRLMDVSDSDINKIEAHRIKVTLKDGTVKEKPMPKSAKYKLAGNSIVVSCLYHIFHQMFIAEPPEPQPIQLSLFDL